MAPTPKEGLWDNIRKNKGSGKKPTKQMLEQEKKIKGKERGVDQAYGFPDALGKEAMASGN